MRYGAKTQKFKDLLDQEHKWPDFYLFKFVVPQDKEPEIKALFPDHQVHTRSSRTGKYISVSVSVMAESSDLVIAIYEKASLIEGLIAL